MQENKIIDIMVTGQWKVTRFTYNGNSRLPEFSPYTFQYRRNMTVDAIRAGAVEHTGDWDGDVSNRTVWADFGIIDEPLSLLNGTWQITNNTSTYVILTQDIASVAKQMRLDKIE